MVWSELQKKAARPEHIRLVLPPSEFGLTLKLRGGVDFVMHYRVLQPRAVFAANWQGTGVKGQGGDSISVQAFSNETSPAVQIFYVEQFEVPLPPPRYSRIGCYTDNSIRDFRHQVPFEETVESCAQACSSLYGYFAIQKGKRFSASFNWRADDSCFCDTSYGTPASIYKKVGDESCAEDGFNMVYQLLPKDDAVSLQLQQVNARTS